MATHTSRTVQAHHPDVDASRGVRFHDYATIYAIPGLYGWLSYQALGCKSHHTIRDALQTHITAGIIPKPTQLRAIDLGAGNGLIGDQLRKLGIRNILGIDVGVSVEHATY